MTLNSRNLWQGLQKGSHGSRWTDKAGPGRAETAAPGADRGAGLCKREATVPHKDYERGRKCIHELLGKIKWRTMWFLSETQEKVGKGRGRSADGERQGDSMG